MFTFISVLFPQIDKKNVGIENCYHKLLTQTLSFNEKHYYPLCTTTYFFFLEMKRGNGQCKFSFDKAVILNIFKSALAGWPCISNLSVNIALYSLFTFCYDFLNFGYTFKFCDTKKNFKDFIWKNRRLKNLSMNEKKSR